MATARVFKAPTAPPPDPNLVDEFHLGRNLVRIGDRVRVLPSRPGKHDGFEAVVRRAWVLPDGELKEVEVIPYDPRSATMDAVDRGRRRASTATVRTFYPRRLKARRQQRTDED